MNLKKILYPGSREFHDCWEIYKSSFPPDERRSLDTQIELLNNKFYNLLAIFNKNQLIGFLAVWEFNTFLFFEHFAIRENLRNKGLGTKLLKEYIIQVNKNIVLEVEKPNTKTARKRIRFYERLGFKLNRYNYVQPSYGQGKEPVPLFLMTLPEKISKHRFLEIKRQLYEAVYRQI